MKYIVLMTAVVLCSLALYIFLPRPTRSSVLKVTFQNRTAYPISGSISEEGATELLVKSFTLLPNDSASISIGVRRHYPAQLTLIVSSRGERHQYSLQLSGSSSKEREAVIAIVRHQGALLLKLGPDLSLIRHSVESM